MELPVKAPVSGGQKTSYTIETKKLSYKLCSKFDEFNWICCGETPRGVPKLILRDVNCAARPGEITAITGPSGAGKTTLLEILAGKISSCKVSGQVLVNSQPMKEKHFRRISGYVTQDDSLFPSLTVKETLLYSALLRLPGGKKEAANRVRRLLKELGLEHIADSRIGEGSNWGISGGERRRVSIGVDLVHDPAVVFIDEPTSGLDSASALHVSTLLKSMVVNQGKTIVLTIHQPGFRILELFDRFVLLSNGYVVHDGSLHSLEERLKFSGHQIPLHVNVLEFSIDAIESLEMQNSVLITNECSHETRNEGGHTMRTPNFNNHQEKPLCYPNSILGEVLILGKRFSTQIKHLSLFMAKSHALFLLLLLLLVDACRPSHQQDQNKISSNDLAALAAVKDSLTDIPGSNFFSTWDFTSPDPCSAFSGITCSLNRVTILTLGTGVSSSRGLAGFLSPSVSNLTELTQLVLYPGLVTGPIPPQLGLLSNLRVLSLTNNRLKGPIPSSLSSLPNLHTLDLSYNQLTGTVPPGLFTGLTRLKVMILASNQLSGELPRIVSAEILHLDLKDNSLTGTLPLRLPSTIRYLSASKNMMWGPLNGLQSLSELGFLDLSMNQFSGPIPSSLLRPPLSSLFLQRNNLSGGVPTSLPSSSLMYGEGSIVDLSHNLLTGELSPVLAAVETLFLNNNRLTGRVPEEYVKNMYGGSTKTLYLQHNYITGFPLEAGLGLPDTVSLCLTYNCMVPLVGFKGCPAASDGEQLSRPESQCVVFNHGRSIP